MTSVRHTSMISSRVTFSAGSGRPALPKPVCSRRGLSLSLGSSIVSQGIESKQYKALSRPQGARARPRVPRVTVMSAAQDKTKVLFVCLGNICRSPTAEAVFKKVVEDAGVADQFEIDSCGTGGGSPDWYLEGGFSYHEGDASDPRMARAAVSRGVKLASRSRPLKPRDLAEFDYILGMDASNITAIKRAGEHWKGKHPVPADYQAKLALMSDYLRSPKFSKYDQVPDPYYGGSRGFELVLDLLDDACSSLLDHIQQQRRRRQEQEG